MLLLITFKKNKVTINRTANSKHLCNIVRPPQARLYALYFNLPWQLQLATNACNITVSLIYIVGEMQ